MPEMHPGSEIEIFDAVPTSAFRCAIPNTKRYMKHNKQSLEVLCKVSYEGDYNQLEDLLATGDESNLFNGDINDHMEHLSPLMLASISGHTECIELLLRANADPHLKERMPYGKDPADGRTSLVLAEEHGWDDVMEVLKKAELEHPYGWYVPEGSTNNKKVYGSFEFGTKPDKGWYSSRPGVAERCGFDPNKYGTGPYRQPAEAFPTPLPAASASRPRQEVVEAVKTIPVALLFPGQGSQYVKMIDGIKNMPAVKTMMAQANDILGYDLLELCLSGPDTKLEETRYCQPAMFVAGMAGIEKLRADRQEAAENFQIVAGLSLGEYTALCAAGVFTFEVGLRLVALRGQAMQEAAGMSKQAMLSVAGMDKPKLMDLCKQAAKKEGANAVCQIANELFPKGFACAGTEAAVHALKELVDDNGALQSKILKTSGAFHTSLMAPAKETLGNALDEALPNMKSPNVTVWMNVTAQPLEPGTDPKVIVELLKKQLVSPVLWDSSVKAMIKIGIKEFYEVGPQKQLKAMMKRIDQKMWAKTTSLEI